MRADAWFERGSIPGPGAGPGARRLLNPFGCYPGPVTPPVGPQETR